MVMYLRCKFDGENCSSTIEADEAGRTLTDVWTGDSGQINYLSRMLRSKARSGSGGIGAKNLRAKDVGEFWEETGVK